jgi:hypothetical protein
MKTLILALLLSLASISATFQPAMAGGDDGCHVGDCSA